MSVPDLFIAGDTPLKGVTEPTQVPLTLEDGTVLGTATLMPDGTVEGRVTDPGVRERLLGHVVTRGFSVSTAGVVVHETREGE